MATHLHRIRNGKQVSATSTPDVRAEPVIKAQGVFHGLFQTQFKHEHTILGDGRDPCWCGRYYAKWACGHYTAPRFIACGQKTLSSVAGIARATQCQTPMRDIIIANLVSVEQCPNCTGLDEDAEAAFRQIDEENRHEEAAFDRDAEEAFQQLEEENRQQIAESLRQEGKSAD